MKKQLLTFLLIISNSNLLFSQPSIQWQKCLGGTNNDQVYAIQQTNDGGYIAAGSSSSNDNDVTGNQGYSDCWIVKLDSNGIIQWQKCLGGTSFDGAFSIQQTTDGGYIIAGYTDSNNGDVTGNHGGNDYWIVKLDTAGIIQWQKSLGGTSDDQARSIQQTSDGGYIVAGYTDSNNGEVTGNHGGNDYWIVKLDTAGIIQWQKSLGGTIADFAYCIQQTSDGGYIIAGNSQSNNGDVTGNHDSSVDYWIVKLDSSGIIQWQKSLGGNDIDRTYSIQQTTDGGYIVAGLSLSNDNDVTGNHDLYDYWIVKLDTVGIIQWQKCLGGFSNDQGSSIQQTNDGGYIISGISGSNNGDVTGNHDTTGMTADIWVVKLDSIGGIEWQKCLGGAGWDYAFSIQQSTDGGYIIAGFTDSNNGDVTGNHGANDYWIVKLDPTVNVSEIQNSISDFQIIPNPISNVTTLSFQLSSINNFNLEILDIEGRLIKNLSSKNLNIGSNEIVWDATNNSGCKVDNGLYFITLVSDNFSETKKVVVLKN